MLIRFVVSNFLSFDEETEFNMLAGTFKTQKHHVYKTGKVEVLKAAALYGANGAGKSNLILAIDFLSELVDDGKIDNSTNKFKFKLNKENESKPSLFEIEFSIEKKIYSYGVRVNNSVILEEWLYESGITKEDKIIFERKQSKTGKSIIKISDSFVKTEKTKLLIELLEENLLKSNELLLSKHEILKINIISGVKMWFAKSLLIIFPSSKFSALTNSIYSSDKFRVFANSLLSSLDTGISSLELESIELDKFMGDDEEETKKEIISELDNMKVIHLPMDNDTDIVIVRENGKNIVKRTISKHYSSTGEEVVFELNDESDGTKRLLDFIPAFDTVLNNEVTLIIDEIDQSLHPVLLYKLIQKIMLDDTTKGQLIFTTHESNLLDLDIFRQDEIWFVEKDNKKGNTQLYSLSEFKPRHDLDVRKGYLKGRFGAIPFLAHLEDLKWQQHDA